MLFSLHQFHTWEKFLTFSSQWNLLPRTTCYISSHSLMWGKGFLTFPQSIFNFLTFCMCGRNWLQRISSHFSTHSSKLEKQTKKSSHFSNVWNFGKRSFPYMYSTHAENSSLFPHFSSLFPHIFLTLKFHSGMSMYKTTCREKEHLCIEIKNKKETDWEFSSIDYDPFLVIGYRAPSRQNFAYQFVVDPLDVPSLGRGSSATGCDENGESEDAGHGCRFWVPVGNLRSEEWSKAVLIISSTLRCPTCHYPCETWAPARHCFSKRDVRCKVWFQTAGSAPQELKPMPWLRAQHAWPGAVLGCAVERLPSAHATQVFFWGGGRVL